MAIGIVVGPAMCSQKIGGLDAPVQQKHLEEILERNAANLGRLAEGTVRLQSIRNRIYGAYPEKEGPGVARPTPNGVMGTLQQQASDVQEVLNIMGELLTELERL